jgi:hypothetical protein
MAQFEQLLTLKQTSQLSDISLFTDFDDIAPEDSDSEDDGQQDKGNY